MRKRSQHKRHREEKSGNGNDRLSPSKRQKTDKLSDNNQSTQGSETLNTAQQDDKIVAKEHNMVDPADEVKMNNLIAPADEAKTENGTDDDDYEEDPEEDPEEDEEMDDESPQGDSSVQDNTKEMNLNDEPGNEKDQDDKLDKGQPDRRAAETMVKSDTKAGEKTETKVDTGEKVSPVKVKEGSVDKELLQVFAFLLQL